MSQDATITPDFTNTIRNTYNSPGSGSTSSTTYRTTSTATDKQPHWQYMGKAGIAAKNAEIYFFVDTTLPVTLGWIEFAVYRGNFVLGQGTTLTRLGWIDAQNRVTNAGTAAGNRKSVKIALDPPITPGDDLWACYGVSAGTMPIFHANARSEQLNCGCFQTVAAGGRPSTLSPVTTVVNATSTYRPVFLSMDIY